MASRAAPEARVIALAGPTASGKTAAALAIAREHPVEIVSVDSALVYRGMDIGTAKPSPAELAAVPHHLIGIRDPAQAYSAAEFARDAHALVREINGRGRIALLAGGTMLYFKAWFEGLDAMPPADPAIRAELEAQAARVGWPALHAQLAQVDPVAAAKLAPADAQRIQRALEVWRATGRPWSSFHGRRPAAADSMTPLFSLEPAQRSWLHERIAQRFEAMLAAGFVDEVQALRARADLSPDVPSMRCVGYRQAWELLDEQERRGGEFALDALRERGVAATRQLAKRQLTWLRGMPARRVIACDAPDALQQLLRRVREALA